jgi:hypothetical protein
MPAVKNAVIYISAVVVASALVSLVACRPARLRSAPEAAMAACGPELPEPVIMEVVRGAVRVSGGEVAALERAYELKITTEGCDYIVIGVRRMVATTDHLVLRIGRSGEIKSWPWCCEPNYFVPLPTLHH